MKAATILSTTSAALVCTIAIFGCSSSSDAVGRATDGGLPARTTLDAPCEDDAVPLAKITSRSLIERDASGPGYSQLHLDATDFYFTADGGDNTRALKALPIAGGVPRTVATFEGFGFEDVAPDPDGKVYIRTESGILTAPKTGTGAAATVLFDSSLGGPNLHSLVATDAQNVYVFDGTTGCIFGPSKIYAVSKETGRASLLDNTIVCPSEIVLDGTSLYIAANGDDESNSDTSQAGFERFPDARLYRVPVGGAPAQLVARVPFGLRSIRPNGGYIYGVLRGDGTPDNTLIRIDKVTGAIDRLGSTGCFGSSQIQLADGRIYYMGETNGFFRRDLEGRNVQGFDAQPSGYYGASNNDIEVRGNSLYELSGEDLIRHDLPAP